MPLNVEQLAAVIETNPGTIQFLELRNKKVKIGSTFAFLIRFPCRTIDCVNLYKESLEALGFKPYTLKKSVNSRDVIISKRIDIEDFLELIKPYIRSADGRRRIELILEAIDYINLHRLKTQESLETMRKYREDFKRIKWGEQAFA